MTFARTALQNCRDNRLACGSTPSLDLAGLRFDVHVSRLAADESFVNLNASFASAQLATGPLVLHGKPDAVKHEPRCFWGHPCIPHDLVTTDSVFAIGDHPSSGKPLVERDRGILENRFGFDGKLLPALRALPDTASLEEHRFLGSAVLAGDALGPSAIRHFTQSVIRIGVVFDSVHQGLGFDVFHALSMPENGGCVNYIIALRIATDIGHYR